MRTLSEIFALALFALILSGCPTGVPAREKLLAHLTLAEGASYAFGDQVIGNTPTLTLHIQNTRAGIATSFATAFTSDSNFTFGFKGGTYPGAGGTCGDHVDGHSECTIIVAYTPSALTSGNVSASIHFSYGSPDGVFTFDIAMTAHAQERALISFQDPTGFDYGVNTALIPLDHTFTINNTGDTQAASFTQTAINANWIFKDGAFPGTGGTCAATIAAKSSCTVVFSFVGLTAGSFSATLAFSFDDGVATTTVSVPVTGQAIIDPLRFADAPTYDYGAHQATTGTDKSFTLTNFGSHAITGISVAALAAAFTFKGGTFPGTGGDCSATLAVGASCAIVVTFTPVTSGLLPTSISLDFSDGATARTVALPIRGTGLLNAVLTISDTPTFDYGSVANHTAHDKTFTITNTSPDTAATGIAPSVLGSGFAYKGGSYPGSGGDCGASLASGLTCSIVVTFTPLVAGPFSSTMRLDYSNGLAATFSSVGVTGTGLVSPVTISGGGTYDYGSGYLSVPLTHVFTVTNPSVVSVSLAVGAPALAAPYSFAGGYPGVSGTCGASLGAGLTCNIEVTFTPASAGTFNDTLRIAYDDGQGPQTATRAVTGKGVVPAVLTISDGPSYNFGTFTPTGSADHTFSVTNSGSFAATAISASPVLVAPFSYKNGSYPGTGGNCGATLGIGSSCNIVVTYTFVGGTSSGTINLSYLDGVTTVSTARDLSASGPPSGSVDTGWGNSGNLGWGAPIGYSTGIGLGAAIQSDGKMVVVGNGDRGDGITRAWVFRQKKADGHADTTFNGNAVATPPVGGTESGATSVAIQLDGKIVVGGYVVVGGISQGVVIRLNTDGSQDAGFGTNGIVTLAGANFVGQINSVLIQQDGMIVALGSGSNDALAVRLDSSGNLDTTFNGTGFRRTALTNTTANVVTRGALLPGGKIVAGSRSRSSLTGYDEMGIIRYNTDGTLDTSLSGVGYTRVAIRAHHNKLNGIGVQTTGKIVFSGQCFDNSDIGSLCTGRLNTDGTLDSSYATNGTAALSLGAGGTETWGTSLLVQPDDKIVFGAILYFAADGGSFLFARMTANGSLDLGFNGTGFQTFILQGSYGPNALVFDPVGKIFGLGGTVVEAQVWY